MRRWSRLAFLGLASFLVTGAGSPPVYGIYCWNVSHEGKVTGCCGNHLRVDYFDGVRCTNGMESLHLVETRCDGACGGS